MKLTSPVIVNEGPIPSKYTCDGQRDLNPPLSITGVPEGAAALALIVEDPDVPKQVKADGMFDHWVLFNIPPDTTEIGEGEAPGTQGANGAGQNAYTGPCPPPQYEPSMHRYIFTLYALDEELTLSEGTSKEDVRTAMLGHMLEEAHLIGTYRKVQ